MVSRKPILCLDFDGVIHSYTSPWIDTADIPDPPVSGAIRFIKQSQEKFRVCIFSSRSNSPIGISAMIDWLRNWATMEFQDNAVVEDFLNKIEWPRSKPAAFITIDDRAITFEGTFPSVDELLKFKPWNKKN